MKTMLVGFAIAAVFAVIALVVIPGYIRVPASIEVAALSPDFWPTVVAWGVVVLAVGLGVQGWLDWRKAAPGDDAEAPENPQDWLRAIAAVAAMIVYYALIPYVGIVAASIPAYIAMAALMGARRWGVVLPVSVVLPIALYFFFVKVANIPLPLGVFG